MNEYLRSLLGSATTSNAYDSVEGLPPMMSIKLGLLFVPLLRWFIDHAKRWPWLRWTTQGALPHTVLRDIGTTYSMSCAWRSNVS
jgi:hypothetical protein